jgi:hypothetical protein
MAAALVAADDEPRSCPAERIAWPAARTWAERTDQ